MFNWQQKQEQSKAATCWQGGRTRPYSSRWCSRTWQSFGVGSPWTSQGRVSRPGRKGCRSNRSWSITRRHARLTALSRAARGLGGVRENCPAERDDCCCCRLSVDFLHQTHGTQRISLKYVFTFYLILFVQFLQLGWKEDWLCVGGNVKNNVVQQKENPYIKQLTTRSVDYLE